MLIFDQVAPLREHLQKIRHDGLAIGLVPTMGNIHEGHMALVNAARDQTQYVVASIFVNPLQFGPEEDYASYPRTSENDEIRLRDAGCDVLFMPTVNEVYPNGLDSHTVIKVPELSELYCGNSRPGHFNGVATVVTKLFNIVTPDQAFFGLKDYQQLQIIRKLVADLCLPISLVGIPTQRESGGLAMSSRNAYMTPEEKQRASHIYRVLREITAAISAGARDYSSLEQDAKEQLEQAALQVDYFNICHAHTLLPATEYDHELVILAAAWIGKTRLIDNITAKIT